jgi:hypothetical protein
LLTTAGIDDDNDIDIVRNQDWNNFRRVRIVDIITAQEDGVEVCVCVCVVCVCVCVCVCFMLNTTLCVML